MTARGAAWPSPASSHGFLRRPRAGMPNRPISFTPKICPARLDDLFQRRESAKFAAPSAPEALVPVNFRSQILKSFGLDSSFIRWLGGLQVKLIFLSGSDAFLESRLLGRRFEMCMNSTRGGGGLAIGAPRRSRRLSRKLA